MDGRVRRSRIGTTRELRQQLIAMGPRMLDLIELGLIVAGWATVWALFMALVVTT